MSWYVKSPPGEAPGPHQEERQETVMSQARAYTTDELRAELPPGAVDTINGWLRRGDGVAIYENQDLGHPGLGDVKYVSFGSSEAQLETDDPPERLPDIGGDINWRYILVGTYRNGELS